MKFLRFNSKEEKKNSFGLKKRLSTIWLETLLSFRSRILDSTHYISKIKFEIVYICSYTLSLYLYLYLSLSHSLFLSLSHTHTHAHTNSLSLSQTNTQTVDILSYLSLFPLTISLCANEYICPFFPHTQALTNTHTHTFILTLTRYSFLSIFLFLFVPICVYVWFLDVFFFLFYTFRLIFSDYWKICIVLFYNQ